MAVAVTMVLSLLGLVALLLGAARFLRWKARRALADPRVDPGAADTSDCDVRTLEEILARAGAGEPGRAAPAGDAAGSQQGPAARLAGGWALLDAHLGDTQALLAAAGSFGAALASEPESAEARCGLAECALKACHRHGDVYWRAGLRRALPLLERALELAGPPDDHLPRALRGLYLARLGELAAAEEAARGLPAEDWRTQELLAVIARIEGRPADGAASLRRAAGLAPPARRSGLLGSLGTVLSGMGRHEEAVAACREALSLQPDNAWAWHDLSLALYRRRRFDEALEASDRALEKAELAPARQLNDHLRRRLGKGWSPEGA